MSEISINSSSSVKVFISSLSASKEAKQQQQRIVQTLDVKKIAFDKKDIALDPVAKREFRMLMRGYNVNGTPPQIFNGDYLCGDYEAFYWAVEEEKLDEFLRLVPPKSKPVTLAAVTAGELSHAAATAHAGKKLPSSETSQLGDQTSLDDRMMTVLHSGTSTVAPPVLAPPLPPLRSSQADVETGKGLLETTCDGSSNEGSNENKVMT